jgi:hypothetical protein
MGRSRCCSEKEPDHESHAKYAIAGRRGGTFQWEQPSRLGVDSDGIMGGAGGGVLLLIIFTLFYQFLRGRM